MTEPQLILHIGKYMDAELVEQKPITSVWHLRSKRDKDLLGIVKWFGPWRQYVLISEDKTFWSKKCLADVITFLDELNIGRRKKGETK